MFRLIHSHHQANYKNKTEKFTVSRFVISNLSTFLFSYTKIYNILLCPFYFLIRKYITYCYAHFIFLYKNI